MVSEQKEQMIPLCILNWKNNKGFTIPLDKHLAAMAKDMPNSVNLRRFKPPPFC
jgi:hypothetical protein